MKRVCPVCNTEFSRGKRVDGIPHCPNCNEALHYGTGKMSGKTIPYYEKKAVVGAIEMIRLHIEERDGFAPAKTGAELARDFSSGYVLLERARGLIGSKNYALDVKPHEFLIKMVECFLKDDYYRVNAKTILQLQGQAAKFATQAFKEIKSSKIDEMVQARDATKIEDTSPVQGVGIGKCLFPHMTTS